MHRHYSMIHVTFLSVLAFSFVIAGIVLRADYLLRSSLTLATLAVVEVLRLLVRCHGTVREDNALSVTGARGAQRLTSTKGWPWAPQHEQGIED